MSYLSTTPRWLRLMMPRGLVWDIPQEDGCNPAVYFTFDDGPHPEITPWVAEQLRTYGAKGTFFCIGDRAVRYPDVAAALQQAGHAPGNHTHGHCNGWQTPDDRYVASAQQAAGSTSAVLFRPPYGRITRAQAKALQHQGFSIIMWSVLTGDFDTARTGQECASVVSRFANPGSIIVFHDSEKAWPRLREALPRALEYVSKQGWEMRALTAQPFMDRATLQ